MDSQTLFKKKTNTGVQMFNNTLHVYCKFSPKDTRLAKGVQKTPI